MSTAPPKKDVKQDPSWSDAEEAAQKRFRIMAGGGLVVVLMLGYLALGPSGDAGAAPAAGSTPDTTAVAASAPVDSAAVAEAPAGPSVPGVSGGGGGGGAGGGGGRPGGGGGGAKPARENSVAGFTQERGVALGLSPRAAAALADSAAGRRGGVGGASPPTSGRATVARATTMMSEPAAGTVLVTVPSGTPLSLSGCQPAAGATWCRATHAGFSGWVRQSDIG